MTVLMRWLRSFLSAGDVARAIEQARLCSRLAVACARRSTESGDAWQVAARAHRARRRAHMWEARELAGRPVRFRPLSA